MIGAQMPHPSTVSPLISGILGSHKHLLKRLTIREKCALSAAQS
jgi:hypothetical protein